MTQDTFDNLTFQERRLALLIDDRFTVDEQIRIQKALEHAKHAHTGQKRDGGMPYVVHPIRVAIVLIEAGESDVNLIVAGLLHDVVEDTTETIESVTNIYGPKVGELVKDATRERPAIETEEMKREAKPQKFRWYITEASVDACKIKSADVIDNMRSWQYVPNNHPTVAKFPRWCDEAVTYYPVLTKKAGSAYYTTFCELVDDYVSLPQFHDYLKGEYTISV